MCTEHVIIPDYTHPDVVIMLKGQRDLPKSVPRQSSVFGLTNETESEEVLDNFELHLLLVKCRLLQISK